MVTSFRFNLSDGTSYEVIYSEVAVKSGRVITTGMEQDFFTSADIGAFWGSYDYEVITASEDELPVDWSQCAKREYWRTEKPAEKLSLTTK